MSNLDDLYFLNGKRVAEDLPLRSLFYGEGVFETVRWKGKEPKLFDNHLDRLENGARILSIPLLSRSEIKNQVSRSVRQSGIEDAYLKICLLSSGKNTFYEKPEKSLLFIVVGSYRGRKDRLSVCVSSRKRSPSSTLLKIKTLNYLENVLARREAVGKGFGDAIFLNSNDEVAEATSSNIFWVRGKGLFTPSIESGILPGITRSLVLEVASDLGYEINERKFRLPYLLNSDFAFLTNSLTSSIYISKINEQIMPEITPQFIELKEKLFESLDW